MSCYHPSLALPDYDLGLSKTGKYKYKLQGSWNPMMKDLYPDGIKIPCGKCLGCRLDRSREWADRMIYELISQNGAGIFVTLTYDNYHVPIDIDSETGECFGFSLCKRDIQLFFKRLRRAFSDLQIRYYSCGEFGGQTHRPHYHAIIFGLTLDNFSDCVKHGRNELGQDYFISGKFQDIWENGFCLLSEVSYKTCAYVARYTMKKFGDDESFALMSRRPGIGKFYLDSHPEVFDLSRHYFSDSNGSVCVSVPKYFFDRLRLTDPERYDILMLERKEVSSDADLLKLQRTSLSYLDLLELEENSLLNKTQILFKRREEVLP